MNLVIPIIAIVGAVLAIADAAPLPSKRRTQALRAAVVLGWLGVLGGAAGIYIGELSGLATLLGVAGCGGLALLPAGMKLDQARRFAAPVGALIPLVAGVLGLVSSTELAGGESGAFLLYAGHWGTLGAALVSALIASALASSEGWRQERGSRLPGMSIGVAIAALCAGAYMMGALRSGPEGVGWALPLSSTGGSVSWQIPPSAQLPQGISLEVVAELGWMGPLLIAGAVVSLATAVATRLGAGRRATGFGWAISAAAALSGLLGLLTSRAAAALPDASAYQEAARGLLSDVDAASVLVTQGKFVADGDLFVPLSALTAELAMLGVATSLGVVAALFSLRQALSADGSGDGFGDGAGDDALGPRLVATALHARDFTLRAVVLGWLSWLLVILIHWSHFGAVGAGSPAEWNAVGVLTIATGVLLLSWSRRTSRIDTTLRELVPGVVFALLVIGLAISLVFDAPFGVSIVF